MLPCQIVGIANFSVRNLKNFVSFCEEIRSSVSSAFCFGPRPILAFISTLWKSGICIYSRGASIKRWREKLKVVVVRDRFLCLIAAV